MPTREEQKQKRKMEILEAALDQFIKRGYAATKISHIAEKAGMSVGLLFHYFENKEQLYLELINLGVSAPNEMVKGLQQLEPLAFFEMCAKMVLQYVRESDFTAKMFVLMYDVFYSEGVPQSAKELTEGINFYLLTKPMAELGQQQGTIREGDPLALSTAFWVALQGAISVYALEPHYPLPEPQWIVDIIKAQ